MYHIYMPTAILPKKLNREVKNYVVRAVNEVLSDPDFGLELSKEAQKRLCQAAKSKKTVPFSEIKKKYY
ncbi:hypothetical protein A3E06_00450 [Candidatus Giovannonibacteria bacterium RIFCSPHIGHO2_12_FULL_44_42]|nr:MAG: hypothetical protein A3E06_00450 [Candidatus Giovannonibacteria bacterium RIFCSPHIGHO2_12_FULL_44_42]OGF90220.1 MAG: hypothetical protein A3I94_03495 [Candidatus Giovannonibacteria bacterium RIFCSPLOWO2_02_FULL_43_54]OGF96737.1 MAG: hypothetical protein A3H08_02645 [Candidatus Giovannonibacteria bacterium RIFCSPLOWO2_12_FULL_44_32]